ncbi:hypothetical protein D3C73_657670 [compost metagenome]
MQWTDHIPHGRRITEMRHRLQDEECILTWRWPEHIQVVYIYGYETDAELPVEQRPDKAMKLFTREEYKAHSGYKTRVNAIGRYAFRVYPCERTTDGMVILKQEDADNHIRFSTGKARIRYSIKYGTAFFSKQKPVRMELNSEVSISKDTLCYVKKEGGFPLHKEDGILYPFIQDLHPGRNVLPEIEINKKDQIKIFFTDGKKYGEMYELIPE